VTLQPRVGDNMTLEDTAYLSGCEVHTVLCEQDFTGSGVVRTDFVLLGRYAQQEYSEISCTCKRCY